MNHAQVSPPRLVFTDLDGSLLDHDSYDWSPARVWLARLVAAGVAVIPVTSKTRAELLSLRLELGLAKSPFIAENGAVIGLPPAWQHARLDRDPADPHGLVIKTPGLDIGFIRTRLEVIRERLGVAFRGMGDMPLDEIIAHTGLPEPAARQARVREGSEPLIWQDDDAALERFRRALSDDGLRLTRGGRFWHVMGEVHKGDSVAWLIERFTALRGTQPLTLGLGDGPNDVPMLEAVARAVLIPGHHGQRVAVDNPMLYRATLDGPRGWVEGLEYWWGSEIPEAVGDGANGKERER
nr:HAD-IIB family hydrolase [Halomonas socia]